MTPLPYVVISPVKDEADHLALTIESMAAQTHRPAQWVIVDDGSSDATRSIAESYAQRLPWITVIDGPGGKRARGAPVITAFNRGLAEIREPHDFLTKLDGDLFLPSHYFEWVGETFAREARAGIVGGRVYVHDGREWVPDQVGAHTVHGCQKSYRRACFDEIGGLRVSMGWDGIDESGAKARDWRVMPLSELQVLHFAQRGSKQHWVRARIEEGRGVHFMGYLPSFVLVRSVFRMAVEKPRVLGGIVLLAGYISAVIARSPPVDDPAAVAHLRREQRGRLRRLLSGGDVEPDRPSAGGPSFWAARDR